MWTRSYSKTFDNIKRDTIWQILTDVNNWPQWHEDLDSCKMEGPFAVGNHFMLKPKGVGAVKITLTAIEKATKIYRLYAIFWGKNV